MDGYYQSPVSHTETGFCVLGDMGRLKNRGGQNIRKRKMGRKGA